MNTPLFSPTTIYLKDYTPPVYQVESTFITIQLFTEFARVTTQLIMHKQHEGVLQLLGRHLSLQSITVNGTVLSAADYSLDEEGITLKNAPQHATIETVVEIDPKNNTHLEGLYYSEGLYCTQNEPEGFRRITFFPDRPDVMSVYTTRIEADISLPILLANGNLVEEGVLPNQRHYKVWHDPTKKPSYLFAAVAGNLSVLQDHYTTIEDKTVRLEIYATEKDLAKCHTAMQALKDAMRWDEAHYGRAYDLDNYMIVAVSQFNMGAMENKGLNIFNTSCVLADPTTTTDVSIFNVKAVIAHEYFHNWTGNRITCRDWFQLCLKEGFTVFRDQSFSTTIQSEAVQRIDDVSTLKAHQFTEDAGPLSHPPRPDHFVEINNFYTATVYEKGAEIIRMIAQYLGSTAFRAGCDTYFERLDGQAVTVEDLLDCLSDGSGVDVRSFLPWYEQAGTPTVRVHTHYHVEQQTLHIDVQQHLPENTKFPAKKPLPIPIAYALFHPQTGEQLTAPSTLLLTDYTQSFTLPNVHVQPIISLLRGFSAPVILESNLTADDHAKILQYETDGFNQWQAAQTLLEGCIQKKDSLPTYLSAVTSVFLQLTQTDPQLAARLLDVPSENTLASRIEQHYQPQQVHQQREHILNALAQTLSTKLTALYTALPITAYADTARAMGERMLRNVILSLMYRVNSLQHEAFQATQHQFEHAVCMTEKIAALKLAVQYQHPAANTFLQQFYQTYQHEPLAIDLWFSAQAGHANVSVNCIKQLLQHANFIWNTPNRVRSVFAHLAQQPQAFWQPDIIDITLNAVVKLDQLNPILGARILGHLSRWYTLEEPLRTQIQQRISGISAHITSGNVKETYETLLKPR